MKTDYLPSNVWPCDAAGIRPFWEASLGNGRAPFLTRLFLARFFCVCSYLRTNPNPTSTTSPISRVVSAYYYCKKNSRDQLCANFEGKTDEDDILAFVKHWGNYGMMQLLLAFVRPEDMVSDTGWAADIRDNVCVDADESGQQLIWTTMPRECPGWYLLKLYVDQRSVRAAQHADGNADEPTMSSLNQVWMHQFLQPAMDHLSRNYAAVGILEEWNTSMQLFQAALNLPKMNWEAAFREAGSSRVNSQYHVEEEETLFSAWNDPRIRELLWLDILLYDHALSVFNTQVREYNIS